MDCGQSARNMLSLLLANVAEIKDGRGKGISRVLSIRFVRFDRGRIDFSLHAGNTWCKLKASVKYVRRSFEMGRNERILSLILDYNWKV